MSGGPGDSPNGLTLLRPVPYSMGTINRMSPRISAFMISVFLKHAPLRQTWHGNMGLRAFATGIIGSPASGYSRDHSAKYLALVSLIFLSVSHGPMNRGRE